MPQYRVGGYPRESDIAAEMMIEADSPEAAERKAVDEHGMTVLHVEPAFSELKIGTRMLNYWGTDVDRRKNFVAMLGDRDDGPPHTRFIRAENAQAVRDAVQQGDPQLLELYEASNYGWARAAGWILIALGALAIIFGALWFAYGLVRFLGEHVDGLALMLQGALLVLHGIVLIGLGQCILLIQALAKRWLPELSIGRSMQQDNA